MIEAIFFDFFGTLVKYSSNRASIDFSQTHQYLEKYIIHLEYDSFIAHWNQSFSQVENQSLINQQEFSMSNVLSEFLDSLSTKEISINTKFSFIDIYMNEWSANIKPFPHLKELLISLSSEYKLGIVSNTHHSGLVPQLLERFEMTDYFDSVITSIDHGRPKPHESIYTVALSSLGVKANHSVFIGDSIEHDYLAPRKFGFYSLLISEIPIDDILQNHIVSKVTDIKNAILK